MKKHKFLGIFSIHPKNKREPDKKKEKKSKDETKAKKKKQIEKVPVKRSNEKRPTTSGMIVLDKNGNPLSSNANQTESKQKKLKSGNTSVAKARSSASAPAVLAKPVILKFMADGKKVANDYIYTGKIGDQLDPTAIPKIVGYNLPLDQINYQVTNKTQVYSVPVKADDVEYQVVPITEKHQIIGEQWIKPMHGRPGASIAFSELPQIPGYQPYTTRVYIVPEDKKKVEVTYAPVQQSVTVVFVTTNGITLGEQTLHGETGESYNIVPEEHHFEGYELLQQELPTNLKGHFSAHNELITLKYKPVESSVTLSFFDETGNLIHKPLSFTGPYGDQYSLTKLPPIDGYELTSDPSLLVGKYDLKPKQIALRYKPAEQSIKVRYWFDKDHKISAGEDHTISGLTGDFYKLNVPQLDGYRADEPVISGKFKPFEKRVINVVYSHTPAVIQLNLQDEAGRPLQGVQPLKQNGYIGKKYQIDLPDIPGYQKPVSQVTGKYERAQDSIIVHYRSNEVSLTINYLDARTKKPLAKFQSKTIKGLFGTAYTIEPKMIDGYQLQNKPSELSGIYNRKQEVVNLMYMPNKSKVIVHQLDQAHNVLFEPFSIDGYFGDEYHIHPDALKGYTFEKASDDLDGTYANHPKDINLYFKSQVVHFDLLPVNQFKKVIDDKYKVVISGMVGQHFSTGLPKIPGFSNSATNVGGTIKADMANTVKYIQYYPKDSSVVVHYSYAGGPKDGAAPYKDYLIKGKVADEYNYQAPELVGYQPDRETISGTFKPTQQDIFVTYKVEHEDYLIEYRNQDGKIVGQLPQASGEFGDLITVNRDIPKGYHLPVGTSNEVMLNGSKHYIVPVTADSLIVELVTQTVDGKDLGIHRQINGFYHQPQSFHAPQINGYDIVGQQDIQINFDLDVQTIKIKYKPQARQIKVRFIDTQGSDLTEPKLVKGKFNQAYDIKAPSINGYVCVSNPAEKQGHFGLTNTETVFIYVAGSDELNQAITPLDEVLADPNTSPAPRPSQEQSEQANSEEQYSSNNEQAPLFSVDSENHVSLAPNSELTPSVDNSVIKKQRKLSAADRILQH
ncbi:MucBP domain-containing protein [Limosilactobacillus vaginalis]|uniref:MucBP domain-containing protein n=1 Tax=Limosilactobacillus vaginalis TaxID=1633 RepID=UPI0024BA7590|nr:MucBP domain-containing protein [Limosilactobacillus vaginalis]